MEKKQLYRLVMQREFIYIFGKDKVQLIDDIKNRVENIYQNITKRTMCESENRRVSLYYLYSFLFSESFNTAEDKLIDMCVLSVLCLDSCLYDDKILDGQQEINSSGFHIHNLRNLEIGRLAQHLIGETESFWNCYYKYYEEYVRATILEREKHFGKIQEYSREEFLTISKGKQAMCKIIPAMFCCLQNDFTLLEDYEKVIDFSSSGMQIYDDLRDWKDDFKSQRVSWILNFILHKSGLGFQAEPDAISDYLFKENLDNYYLDMAKDLLDMALVVSSEQLSSTWYRYIRFSQGVINKLRADLLLIRGIPRIELDYFYQNDCASDIHLDKKVLDTTLGFLIEQYKKNVMDVKEWMLSATPDSPEEIEILGGDIFMRAQMFNLLSESAFINKEKMESILEKEKDYLLSAKSQIYKYGWVYVEGLYGNCPDLDTFAEMLRAAYCSCIQSKELSSIVEDILNKVLKENTKPNFSTWIIDPDEPAYDFLMDHFTMMGDLEVTSNLIKSLYRMGLKKYEKKIAESLAWIETNQNPKGFWDSTWYVGNYYCGYVLSHLGKIDSFLPCYHRFLNYVYQSQNKNGSWGDGSGNPLDTAYAIYSIVEAADDLIEAEKEAVKRGVVYLLSSKNDNGYWFSCEFIKMGKGKEDISYQNLRYRSVTLTTVYCFAALAKVFQKLGE